MFVAIPVIFQKRNVFYKHRGMHMYDGRAYLLAQLVIDFPFVLLECCLFAIILYFMAVRRLVDCARAHRCQGLNTADDGLRWFYMWIMFIMMEVSMGNFIRMVAATAKELDTIQTIVPGMMITQVGLHVVSSPRLMMCQVFFAGFIIARGDIPPYLVRIHDRMACRSQCCRCGSTTSRQPRLTAVVTMRMR